MSRNPFATVERVASRAGEVLAWVAVVLCVGILVLALMAGALSAGWGWYTLLLVPGIPAAFVVMGFGIALSYAAKDGVATRWRRAKWRWEDEHTNHALPNDRKDES